MKRTIQVCLGSESRRIGDLHFEAAGARERSAFAYDETWLLEADRFALEPALPLVAGPQFHRKTREGSVFHAAIADAGPDGWAKRIILRDHAKRRQSARRSVTAKALEPLNAMDFLLAVDDESRVGALRLRDEQGVFCRAAEPGRRTAPPLVELGRLLGASRAVETDSETAADLAYLRGRGTSLGGMRPKCTVIDDAGRLMIGKFPSVHDDRAVTKGEVLAMHLARAAGIRAAEASLISSDGVPVALIRRFDRSSDGRRVMYVSAATLMGADPHGLQEHSYAEMVDAIRQHGAEVKADTEELWRRIAFAILITNVDDHLHNHGFLHVWRGQWRLAPAFDLNPFPERHREFKTWISPATGPAASVEALISVAPYFRLPLPKAREILREVGRAVAAWRKTGAGLGMTTRELDRFEAAFEHEERVVAKRWAR